MGKVQSQNIIRKIMCELYFKKILLSLSSLLVPSGPVSSIIRDLLLINETTRFSCFFPLFFAFADFPHALCVSFFSQKCCVFYFSGVYNLSGDRLSSRFFSGRSKKRHLSSIVVTKVSCLLLQLELEGTGV